MKKIVGVWIDHRKAIIVDLTDRGENVLEIPSNMEKHVRFSGGAETDSAERRGDTQFIGHLQIYHDKVASCLHNAESIFILGPGESKGEFEKRLSAGSLGARIVSIDYVDTMMCRQVVSSLRGRLLSSIENLHQSNSN